MTGMQYQWVHPKKNNNLIILLYFNVSAVALGLTNI